MKYPVLLLAALVALSSCEDAAKQRVKEASDAVMTIHDQVMPKSEQLMSLKTKIKEQVKRDSSDRTTGDSLTAALERADNAMMDWMSAYDPNVVQNDPPEKALAYFEFEKDKLQSVNKQIDESIARAKEFLGKTAAPTSTQP